MSDFKTVFKENYKGHEIEVKQAQFMGSFVDNFFVAYVQVVPSDGKAYERCKRRYDKLGYLYFPVELHDYLDVLERDGKVYMVFDNDKMFNYDIGPWKLEDMTKFSRRTVDNVLKAKQKEEQDRIKARKEFDEALREGYLPFSTDF